MRTVSNLQHLLDTFSQDSRTTKLVAALNQAPAIPVQVLGLQGAQRSFLAAAVYQKLQRHFLLIADNKEEAAYWQNDLASLLAPQTVHFFPDSFKRPLFFSEINSTNVLQRAETINALSLSTKGEIIVTYPEALFEKVVAPQQLSKTRIQVAVGEKLDLEFLTQVLVEYRFSREDFVYEPGQFSLRGAIIDLYSFGNDYPYRIELFDDEVESIRTFDPLTQRSIQNINRFSLVPNINTRFASSEKVMLFEVLDERTPIWFSDLQYLLDRLLQAFEKAEEYGKTLSILDESEAAALYRDRAFVYPREIVAAIKARPVALLDTAKDGLLPTGTTITYRSKQQPSFNRNFNLLIENLQANTQQRLTNYLFTENPKQVERFYAIFEDLGAKVDFHPIIGSLQAGFIDPDLKLACYTDHQIFDRFHRYKLRQGFSKDQALSIRLLRELQPGDFVTHIDHGIGKFSGMQKIEVNGHVQECVRLVYKNNDLLYVSINSLHKISKYVGKEGTEPTVHKLGSDAWRNLKARTKKKVKDIAAELIKLYAQRKAAPGFAFANDSYLQNELEASFLYEDTPDQLKATIDVKNDMMKPYPMDRLICGDVGFGKTEVAIRAAFKAVLDGKQVAVLVPTTILALQHYKTFGERLKEFSVEVDYLNRFRTASQRKVIFEKLKAGKIDLIIGTHSLLGKEIGFKDLGLLIVDEEQKFGVQAKEKLRNLKVNVDTLTLTATPIPRTLQFSLMAARDLSVIRTPPPNRQPIHTEVRIFSEELVRESVYYEVNRGGQVFFVHNRVKNLPELATMIKSLCPDVSVEVAHGQLEAEKLEQTLLGFINREFDVLVCTNIIETGLDIANANTMIINNAHQFGLSDLHQLRGRVGRSNKKAYCYLFSPPLSTLTAEARKRLRTIEEFADLGSGFQIAMRDLDIRGAGNLLGGEQSGFIADIGYETYQKILEEAILELKETEFRDLFAEELQANPVYVRDVQIDTDVEMLIPDQYVSNVQERLSLYTELDKLETEAQINAFADQLRDRFGRLPRQVNELFEGLRLRWISKQLGFERIILKNDKLRAYFVENPQSPFYESQQFAQLVAFVGAKGREYGLSFKQSNKHFILVKDGVPSLKAARAVLLLLEELALAPSA